jgi:hypothetical protein
MAKANSESASLSAWHGEFSDPRHGGCDTRRGVTPGLEQQPDEVVLDVKFAVTSVRTGVEPW